MHGGADGSGVLQGARNGNYKHGRYTKEVAATRHATPAEHDARIADRLSAAALQIAP
jgi:hypothetical protein